jgi:hypothetical protein
MGDPGGDVREGSGRDDAVAHGVLTPSRRAMSLFRWPSARSCITSRSRAVRLSDAAVESSLADLARSRRKASSSLAVTLVLKNG